MRKKREQPEGSFGEPAGTSRLTPMEIQQKEFGVTRVGGGYRMRDVDEFLDQLTNSMTALVDENRKLKEQVGSGAMIGAPDLADVGRQADEIIRRARDEASQILREANAARSVTGGLPVAGDRAGISAFLLREREFLQSLAGLVQGHAETVKGMAKDARHAATSEPPARPEETQAASTVIPAAERREEPPAAATASEPVTEAKTAFSEPVTEAKPASPEPVTAAAQPADPPPEPSTSEAPAPATLERPAPADPKDPVRLEEPEPATVGRVESDDQEEGDRSLRELFWGEEN